MCLVFYTPSKMFHVLFYCLLSFHMVMLYSINPELQNDVLTYKNLAAVKRLQKYIQLDTSRIENIEHAVKFWRRQAEELGLPFAVYRSSGSPICVITLRGRNPELPSIMLNSHSDVVPANADEWTYPPYSAHIDDGGNIYGRGTQDCKSTGIQCLEAIRKLLQKNITLERTVHLTIVSDEETGGERGMKPFVNTKEFKSLNVGFALDEGMPSSSETMYALYQDKRAWQMKFNIRGEAGHGSIISSGSAIEQVQTLINTAMAYRNQQLQIMKSRPAHDFGAYTSLNINMIQGGLAANIVPHEMTVVMDARLAVEENVSDFGSMINSWMAKLGRNTSLEFIRIVNSSEVTAVDDSNQYWVAMRDAIRNLGLPVLAAVSPATSDMLYVRGAGVPGINFTVNRLTQLRAHGVDEYIPVTIFLDGIDIYVAIIQSLANVADVPKKITGSTPICNYS